MKQSDRTTSQSIVLLFVLAWTSSLHGQNAIPERVGVGPAQKKLSFREAIQLALTSNLEIEIEKTNTAIAQQAIRAAQGSFDPSFRWLPSYESRNTPVGSVLLGSDGKLSETFHNQNFQFLQKLPKTGSVFSVDFENNRQTSTNPFNSLNPLFNSRLFVNFNQPLWRNREIDAERAELRIRRKQFDISETEFELKVIDVIARVEQAYWNLVAARQDVQVQAESVKLAQEQFDQNKRMIDAGMLAPVELAASKAELERRNDMWYSSVGRLTEVENTLKTLLSGSRLDEIWKDEIIPLDDRVGEASPEPELGEAVTQALQRRPEMQLVNQRQETNQVQKLFSASQTKPQVNFVASYGNTGLGGSLVSNPNDPFTESQALLYDRVNDLSAGAGLPPLVPPNFGSVPPYLVGGYGTALSNLFSGRFQSVLAGLVFQLNVRNRTAQANLAQSLVTERRLKLEQSTIEQIIELETRNALQEIRTTRQRIIATSAGVQAAQEKLESETRLFQSGESTNFLVLTRQNELSESRRRMVVANLDFNKAVARLGLALGKTLDNYNITLK
jgi:outer membrane protein TolC